MRVWEQSLLSRAVSWASQTTPALCLETLGYLELNDKFGWDWSFNPLNSGKTQRLDRESAGDELIIAGREAEVPKPEEEEGIERPAIEFVTDDIEETERKKNGQRIN